MGDRNGCGFATHLKKLDDSSGREFLDSTVSARNVHDHRGSDSSY